MRMSTLAAAAMAFAAYKYLKRQRSEMAVGLGTASPGAAEWKQSTGAAPTGKWVGSTSQQSSEPISNDMPDLTRGA